MKIAVIAVDRNPMYSFFAPLTALMWRHVVGYEPLVILVDEPHTGFLKSTLEARDIRYLHVGVPEGYRSSNTAQIARLYGWMAAKDDDHVIVSDADMWPLSRSWFESCEAGPGQVSIMYANNRTRFPICYVAAHAGTWYDMFSTDEAHSNASTVQMRVWQHMAMHLSPQTHAADAWQHDEEWLTSRVQQWSGYPDHVRFIDRAAGEPPRDRLDRAAWGAFSPSVHFDAHLLRPGPAHWPALRTLLMSIAPHEVAWADEYVVNFSRS